MTAVTGNLLLIEKSLLQLLILIHND